MANSGLPCAHIVRQGASMGKQQRVAKARLPEVRQALEEARRRGNRSAIILFEKVVAGLESLAKEDRS